MTNAGQLYRVSGWATSSWELGLTIVGLISLGITARVTNGLTSFHQLLIRSSCSPSPKGLLNRRVNALEENRSAPLTEADRLPNTVKQLGMLPGYSNQLQNTCQI